jgi:hypothetical protein
MKFFDLFRTGNKTVLSNAAIDGSRPVLTVGQAEKLLGDKIEHMVMYNMKTLKPLKDTYNEQKVIYGGQVSYLAASFKDMYAQYVSRDKKPMWVAIKSVSAWDDKGYDLLKPAPGYDSFGRLIIGNVIFYDFKQKKYTTLYPNGSWIRVCVKGHRDAAKESILNTLDMLCRYYTR